MPAQPEWQVNSVHFVIFNIPRAGSFDALQPWQKLFNGTPESFQQVPQGNFIGSIASGRVNDYFVQLNSGQNRLELALAPAMQTSLQEGFIPPHIADLDATLSIFTQYAHRLSQSEQNISRLAVLINGSAPFPDARAATLNFYLASRVQPIPVDATDLSLSMNVRRRLVTSGIEINRICRWATGVGQTLQVSFDGTVATPNVSQTHATLFFVDVNTAPDHSAPSLMNASDKQAVIKELVEEAKQLIHSGYDRLATDR